MTRRAVPRPEAIPETDAPAAGSHAADPLTAWLNGADARPAATAGGPTAAPVDEPPRDVTAFVCPADETGPPGDGAARNSLGLMVDGAWCGACVQKIERALNRQPGVSARLNLTTKRLTVRFDGPANRANDLAARVTRLGYAVAPYDPARLKAAEDREERDLLRALAVGGFAAANVMLLSVAVWAGHASGMGQATRDLLHWFSALIALPAVAYAGLPFYRSAVAAVRAGGVNMDVPISLGVVLATGVSVYETAVSGHHAYFDSAVTLLFFLLIGRFLDRRARGRARSAVERLMAFRAGAVTVVEADGTLSHRRPEDVAVGDRVLVAAGERIGVDGLVQSGRSSVDTALITGESVPVEVAPGAVVHGGTINLGAPIVLQVTAVGENTVLAEIVRLMETAEQKKARHVALADRLSRAYAPVVHVAAAAAFLGWWGLGGLPWDDAMMIAVAVLIVTCPCALGLAVPAVQVIAAGRLMRGGVLLKSATALERLIGLDTVVFDKTGTLTDGSLDLAAAPDDPALLDRAAAVAATSTHPLARALVRAAVRAGRPAPVAADGVTEHPGRGLEWVGPAGSIRLGNRAFVGAAESARGQDEAGTDTDAGPELWFAAPGETPVRFVFADRLRADAAETVAALKARGLAVKLISGDRPAAVARVAEALGITDWQAAASPADKVAALEALVSEGRRVAMVGDGLNDAPALAAATVSIGPAGAADVAQTAADAVFQGQTLSPVLDLMDVAHRADRLVRENFALAFAYNVVTVPIALAGFVTPLIAAVAMSSSSLVVVGNALRLAIRPGRRPPPDRPTAVAVSHRAAATGDAVALPAGE